MNYDSYPLSAGHYKVSNLVNNRRNAKESKKID